MNVDTEVYWEKKRLLTKYVFWSYILFLTSLLITLFLMNKLYMVMGFVQFMATCAYNAYFQRIYTKKIEKIIKERETPKKPFSPTLPDRGVNND